MNARALVCAVVLVLGACADSRQAASTDTSPSFAGQTVRLVVGVSAGGAQDAYTRIMAPFFARYLPGQPSVVVENMPGAGGLVAATYLARRAEPDGLVVGFMSAQAVMAQLVSDAAQFDVRDLSLVGTPAVDGYVCAFSRESGFTLEAWQRGRVPRLGVTNVGSAGSTYALLVIEALGLPARTVAGYAGTTEIRSAMASGEVDGLCVSSSSFPASFQPGEDYVPVLQGGDLSDPIAGVPRAEELATTERAKSLLRVAGAVGGLTRFIALPPRTPAPIVSAVRDAFARTVTDPAFLAAAKTARLDIRPRGAEALEAQVRDMLSLQNDIRDDVVDTLRSSNR